MGSYNRVMLMGNLTRSPELKHIPNGKAVCEFGIAVNQAYKGKEGGTIENTLFVEVTVWEKQAETSAEFLKKGSSVFIEGRLQLDQWENDKGEKRSKMRVRADRVQFLSSPTKPQNDAQAGNTAPPARTAEDVDGEEIPF